MAKNALTEKQIEVENQAPLKYGAAWKLIEEYKTYRYKLLR